MKVTIAIIFSFLFSGCLGMPRLVRPVTDFDLSRYLGKWYEIARLDNRFEKGLSHVTAEYSLRKDGGLQVINRGYSEKTGNWKKAEGKAYFVTSGSEGYLKVSFWGPFYGSYVIFELDHDHYQYAFVSGNNLSYLWLLSRTPTVSPEIIEKFKTAANLLGFDTGELVYVNQT